METTFHTERGTFELIRPGAGPRSPLRAWDAADEMLCNDLAGSPDLIVNDSFGAIASAFAADFPTSVSDSFVALQAAKANLDRNRLSGPVLTPITDMSNQLKGETMQTAVIRIPRSLALLEHQLHLVRQRMAPNGQVVGAGMAKHIHTSTLKLFEQIIGPTSTSLAKKKARLIHSTVNPDLIPPPNPWPQTVALDNHRVVAHAGVFGGLKFDIGTRALLDCLPDIGSSNRLVDLGCGNGLIGTVAGRSGAHITFVDESYLAIESARATFALNQPESPDGSDADFVLDDAGSSLPGGSFDTVINNPPFHENNATSDAVAWRMFNQAHRILGSDGELRVVGNRHLGYHTKLKRIFGNCQTVGSTRKFVVLSARR